MQTFATSMSNTVRWIGILTVVIVVVGIAIVMSRDTPATLAVPLAGILALALALSYALSPLRYEMGGGRLVIRRQVGRSTVELRGALVREDTEAFKGLVRVFGNGGFFAFDGLFYSRRLGMVKVAARRRDHGIVIQPPGGRPLLVSPDDPRAFIAAAVGEGALLSD
ncbi:PH domain-containing protein [Luteibacter sp.]|uniref:PH domain-containing protein n=1 Tax=Luteibacter sp. TaxID=1886636 RepID=UPI003F7DFAD7